ncbi:hypothetical protein M0R88_13130 [Halorussus gelatinilyticus]|uniref:Uncharacterized protein n=1 Tax=Halorussus gelatinilyticus TaxID=2937524 RepID=A0A8U0IHA5_9EURY|nr:hypothetical protein [Halorussus gelatinilyticus]UPV99458.1 hypothetical protein M0R88_13130 [Halorussus gelatinilyticus]
MHGGTSNTGLVGAIRYDIQRLHESWMALFFPRQRSDQGGVLGKWEPSTTSGRVAYRGWSAVGTAVVALLYPLTLFGFAARYYTRKIDGTATRLGVVGVLLLSLLVWGGLTALARLRFSTDGFLAVGAAGGVATVAAVLAYLSGTRGGRFSTVLLAYPFAMTAIFLPPVVAALYSPTLSEVIFPKSYTLAVWLLDNPLDLWGINTYLREQFTLEGANYAAMWFGLSVPTGWLLGLLVTLADVVRPKGE